MAWFCSAVDIEFVSLDGVTWADAPDRDEAGTPNVVGAVALAAAMQALEGVGLKAIARHEAELTAHALERLSHIKGLRIYGDADPQQALNRLGVIAFNIESQSHALVAAVLSTEFGIGVRNGCFCAHPYITYLLGFTQDQIRRVRARMAAGDRSAMPGMVRVSFGAYNTIAEIDTLADALEQITRREYRGKYTQDRASGEFSALGWLPNLAEHFTLSATRPAGRPELHA